MGESNIISSDTTFYKTDTSDIESLFEYKNKETDKEIICFSVIHLARRGLPYGIWTCKDGREVVFNREYQPFLQRKDNVNSYADRDEWVKDIISVQYLFNDLTTPTYYLTRYLQKTLLSPKQIKDCKKSFFICLKVLKHFTPKESGSVNREFSLF